MSDTTPRRTVTAKQLEVAMARPNFVPVAKYGSMEPEPGEVGSFAGVVTHRYFNDGAEVVTREHPIERLFLIEAE